MIILGLSSQETNEQPPSTFSPFVLGYKSAQRQNRGWTQYGDALSCPPSTILCLCVLSYLFFLPNISNPHAPMLEDMNPPLLGLQLGWWQKSPHKGGSWQQVFTTASGVCVASGFWIQVLRVVRQALYWATALLTVTLYTSASIASIVLNSPSS